MSVYNKSIDKIINVERTKWIAPGPYVPLITSNIHVFHVPEMRYEEDCELLKQALLQVPGIIETTVDLETKTQRLLWIDLPLIWNRCGIRSYNVVYTQKCLGK